MYPNPIGLHSSGKHQLLPTPTQAAALGAQGYRLQRQPSTPTHLPQVVAHKVGVLGEIDCLQGQPPQALPPVHSLQSVDLEQGRMERRRVEASGCGGKQAEAMPSV